MGDPPVEEHGLPASGAEFLDLGVERRAEVVGHVHLGLQQLRLDEDVRDILCRGYGGR